MAYFFEMIKIIYNFATEEGYTIFKSWFVNDHSSSFGFNSFHDALDAALTEIIRVAFHGETVYTDDNFFFFGNVPLTVRFIGSG